MVLSPNLERFQTYATDVKKFIEAKLQSHFFTVQIIFPFLGTESNQLNFPKTISDYFISLLCLTKQ